MIRGCGDDFGFGYIWARSKETNSPSKVASSEVHSAFMASICSRTIARR